MGLSKSKQHTKFEVAETFVLTISTIHMQPINIILPALGSHVIVYVQLYKIFRVFL